MVLKQGMPWSVMGSRMDHQLQWVPGSYSAGAYAGLPDLNDTEELFWDALAWLQSGVDDG